MNAVEQVKQAVATTKPLTSLDDLIHKSIEQLKVALPNHMNAERMVRIALTTLRLNPKLYEVAGRNPKSFIAALFQCAQLGLEPNTIGEAWLIPYGNEVKFQIGVYGWAKLFFNHQNSLTLQMEKVHQNDYFEYDLGSGEVSHKPPKFGDDRGQVIGYYAQAKLANGGKQLKTMSVEEARDWAIRYSKCWHKEKKEFISGTPWKEHFNSMAQVTVLKQVLKVLPKSPEIQRAFQMDETVKTEVNADMSSLPDETDYTELTKDEEIAEDLGVTESEGMMVIIEKLKTIAGVNKTIAHLAVLFGEGKITQDQKDGLSALLKKKHEELEKQ